MAEQVRRQAKANYCFFRDSLGSGVIELARLADDDRAGADDEDAVDVGALGHNRNGKMKHESGAE